MPRRTSLTVLATVAVMIGIVAFHPAEPFEAIRRAIGIGAERQLAAPSVVRQGGAFAFAMTQSQTDATPVGWDPCQKIRYRVNPAGEPRGGRELINRAIARISDATGLAFEDEGDTDDRPFPDGVKIFGNPDPVVIGWAAASEYPELAAQVAGVGGAIAERGSSGRRRYGSGGVALDTEAFTDAAVAQQPRVMEAVVVHELAHVVGLAHVSEPMELMYTDNIGQVELGPGDLEGLARLGSLPCG